MRKKGIRVNFVLTKKVRDSLDFIKMIYVPAYFRSENKFYKYVFLLGLQEAGNRILEAINKKGGK